MENQYIWEMEQHGVPLPLKEWVLTDPILRLASVKK